MRRLRNIAVLGGALQAAALLPTLALGAEEGTSRPHYAVSAGVIRSDNAGRTATNTQGETSLEVGLNGGWAYDRGRLRADGAADLQYRTHSYGNYDDQLLGGLTANFAMDLLRERLQWIVEDNFGQSLIDSQDVATPGNTQNMNFFSTGPSLHLPFGARTQIGLEGRWSDVAYENSDVGNRRVSGQISVIRQLGEHSSLSLNGSTQHVMYKELPPITDYDVDSVFLGWNAVGLRTSMKLKAGYSRLKGDLDSSSGATFEVELQRKLTARSDLSFFVGREFGNSGDSLRRDQLITGVSAGAQPLTVAADPQRSDYATVHWTFAGERSSATVSADFRQEKHERDTQFDREYAGANLQVTRHLSGRLSLDFSVDYSRQDFTQTAINFNEWTAGLGLGWSISDALHASAGWDRIMGGGTTSQGPLTRDYTENRYTVRVAWSPRR